jgi:hypothetical protein
MAKKVKLPPIPEVRTVELNRDERNLLEGLLSWYREQTVNHRDTGEITKEQAKAIFDKINALSDKIMPEEEAAAILQGLGFEIVEKA